MKTKTLLALDFSSCLAKPIHKIARILKPNLFVLLLVINSAVMGQVQFTPSGVFDKAYDNYGNSYNVSDLQVNTNLSNPNRSIPISCSSGYFDLYFEIGSGMEDVNNFTHNQRRDVLCQVFNDISAFITPVNGNNHVRILVGDITQMVIPWNPQVLGVASPYYILPGGAPTVKGIADNMIWTTINSGKDAYTGVVNPLITTADNEPNSGLFYHGFIAMNVNQPWNYDLTMVNPAGQFDLYTMLLHEVTHALGFASLISEDGTAKFAPFGYNYYSRYDLHLQTQASQNLLTNTGACSLYDYGFNPALTALTVLAPPPITPCNNDNTVCATAVKFNYFGTATDQPVFTPNCFAGASSLSHFEDVCRVPTPQINNAFYVMSNATGLGAAGSKRFFRQEERDALCELGYKVGTSFGNNLHSSNNTTYTGGACSGINIAGINDGINPNGTFTWLTNVGVQISIPIATVIANDYNTTTIECVQSVFGNGTPTVSGGNILLTPTQQGVALLRYIPVNTGTGQRGNITYIIIRTNSNNCTPIACGNMIANGDLETGPASNSLACVVGFLNQIPCWSEYVSSPDYFGPSCSDVGRDIPTNLSPQPNDTWSGMANGNNHFLGIWRYDFDTEESAQVQLNTPIVNGTYIIKFWAKTANVYNWGTPGNLYIAGSTNTLPSNGGFDPAFAGLTVLAPAITLPADPYWYPVERTFTYTGGTALNNLIIAQESLTGTPVTSFLMLDHFELYPINSAPVFHPQSPLCAGQTILLSATPPGGTFAGTGVINNGNGTYSFNASAAGTGKHNIRYMFTTAQGCAMVTGAQIEVKSDLPPTASINSPAPICQGNTTTLTASGGGTYLWSTGATTASISISPPITTNYTVTVTVGTGCTASAMRTVSVTPNPITLTHTTTSPNQTNGVPFNYNFTVCNSSTQPQTVSVAVLGIPAGLTVTNMNGWQYLFSALYKTVTVPAGGCLDQTTGGLWFTVQPNINFSGATNCSYSSQLITCNSQAYSSTTGCSAAVLASRNVTVYSHRVVGSTVGVSSLQTAINWGILSANGTTASQTFTVNGNFAIDVAAYQFGISAANNAVQTNVFCYPGSQITVNSGKKLTAYWTNFNGCTTLWRGIVVVGTGTPGELVLRQCNINDAQYGILANHGSKLNVALSVFNECFIGVYANSTLTNALLNLTGPFTQNYFFSTGNMKANYAGMVNAPAQPPANTIPSTNRRTWAGMHINGISALSISSLVSTGITNGIVANNCNLSIIASNFNEHHAYGYNFNGIQGHGIYCSADYGIGGIGQPPFVAKSLYQRGSGYGPPTCHQTFVNCDNGITVLRMHVDVGLNCISATNGITVNNSQRANIRINQNSITSTNRAVFLNNNDPVNLTDIGPNEITVTGTGANSAGISILEQNNPPLQSASIHHNKVYLNGWFGINLTTCSGAPPVANTANTYKVYNNTIVVQNPNWVFSGINYDGSHNLESNNNLITGTGAGAQAFFGNGTPVGLRASISDGNFSCENPSTIFTGIRFEGTCNGGTFGTRLKTIEMNSHTYGIHITGGALLNDQGNPNSGTFGTWGNRWTGTYASGGYWGRNDNSTLTRFYYRNGSASSYGSPTAPTLPASGWFFTSADMPLGCNTSIGAGFKNEEEGEETELTDLDEQIITDNLQFDEFEEQLKWQSEKIVYEKLKENMELIEPGSETAAFFEEKQNSTIGQLSDLEEGRNGALQPTIYQSQQLDELLHQKEILMMQLAYADTLIDSTSTSFELSNWQTLTANLYTSLQQVNNAINQFNQSIDNSFTVNAEQLSNTNSTINASQQVDNNLKLLNDIYLNTVAVGIDTFTNEQLNGLYYLAAQCPLAGGEAVYRSRSLLALVADTAFNDRDICTAAGIAYKRDQATKLNETSANSKLQIHTYPNPANTYLLLQSNIAYTKDLQASIYDNMGRNVKEQSVSLAGKKVKIDLQELSSGLYFLRLMNGTEYIYTTKFNVQH